MDPSIYGGNTGLRGFPLSSCEHTSGEGIPEGHGGLGDITWLCYSVIPSTVFGSWLWFGALFFLQRWRFSFLRFVDGLGIRVVLKLSHAKAYPQM